ncbi:hypothetical protein NC652_004997 [Populus alba x Populus x berolinensis]|nr:hypothetical protein NC652_004997 [Populus alba x Populus x berolinensis]
MECATFVGCVAEDWGFRVSSLLPFASVATLNTTALLEPVSRSGSAIYDVSSRQSLFSTIIEEQPISYCDCSPSASLVKWLARSTNRQQVQWIRSQYSARLHCRIQCILMVVECSSYLPE